MSKICLAAVIVFVLSLTSCRKEIDLATWNADYSTPLAKGSLNLANYLQSDYLQTNSAGLFIAHADETLLRLGLDTIIHIPDTTISESFLVPVSLSWPAGMPFMSITKVSSYNLGSVNLYEAVIRDSKVIIQLKNTIDESVLFRYRILNATQGTDTFSVSSIVPANSVLNDTFDLNGYHLNLKGTDNKGSNTVVSEFKAEIYPAQTYTFKAGDRFDISNSILNVVPQYARGYFGKMSSKFNETQPIKIFQNLPIDRLNFTEFDAKLTIDNGIGADLSLKFDRLRTRNSSTGKVQNLVHPIIGTENVIARALDYGANNGVHHVRKSFVFNELNSNLDELIEAIPDELQATFELGLNPFGNVSFGNDFLRYGHDLTLSLNASIPLIVGFEGLRLVDTAALAISPDGPDFIRDRVDEMTLTLTSQNYYPVSAELRFYLLDAEANFIDSLHQKPIVIEGANEINGQVNSPRTSVAQLTIDRELRASIEASSMLRTVAILSSVGNDTVHLRSNGRIDYKISAKAAVNMNKK